jgi:beta-phosphoglucomutase-like phosphatase (HAD superfamily)
MPNTRPSAAMRPIRAWIFDWDGIFVDSERWKAWTYGLGLLDVYPDFGSRAESVFDPTQPRPEDAFLQVCGRYVGKSREEYARGVLAHYDGLGYGLSRRLLELAANWVENAPERIGQIGRERSRTGVALEAFVEPWEVFFELRRPYYLQYQENVEPIEPNLEFLAGLPQGVAVGLVTRTPEDRVRSLMERFAIPIGRFGALACRPEKNVSKAQMYEDAARRLGIPLDDCAAVEDTETGVADAAKAGSTGDARIGLIIACPTPMTESQEFGAADLLVRGGLLRLRALAAALGQG